MAARLALMRAQRQLYKDAGIHIHVRNFAVINSVGAFNLKATLNCDAFATEHSATAHYDVKSFVGLAVCFEARIQIDFPIHANALVVARTVVVSDTWLLERSYPQLTQY